MNSKNVKLIIIFIFFFFLLFPFACFVFGQLTSASNASNSSSLFGSNLSLITLCPSITVFKLVYSVSDPSAIGLNVNICLHIGHNPLDDSCSSHFNMQCRWKL